MTNPTDAHNQALLPILRIITENAEKESQQWVILESLCLGVGKLHGRTPRQTAAFIDAMAERIATGERV